MIFLLVLRLLCFCVSNLEQGTFPLQTTGTQGASVGSGLPVSVFNPLGTEVNQTPYVSIDVILLELIEEGTLEVYERPSSLSEEGLDFLMETEGFRPEPYWDHNQWSVGYGVSTDSPDTTIDHLTAIQALLARVEMYEQAVYETIQVDLTQSQFDALVSLAFNIGINGFKNSTLVKKINNGETDADRHFLDWIYASGEPILRSRREQELELYRST